MQRFSRICAGHIDGREPIMGGWEVVFISAFGVIFIVTLLVLAVLFPHPTAFQLLVFRTTLALSAAGIAAAIPGFLNLSMDVTGLAVRAGGALAVFVLVYRLNPARTIAQETQADHSESVSTTPRIRSERENSANQAAEIETLEQLVAVVSGLSSNQRRLLSRISKSRHGVHVGDLTLDLQLARSDVVYRARDLERDGLIEIKHLTDTLLELSDSVKKLIGLHQNLVLSLLQQND
jgi:DNA-binding MarR family transcriptional regulator